MNKIAGATAWAGSILSENRFVGMKSRGVYEAPGMTVLYAAHLAIEQLTLDRDMVHLRDRLSPEVAEMVYYGFWYVAEDGRADGVFAGDATGGERRSDAWLLQGQCAGARADESEQSVRCGDGEHGRLAAATIRPMRKDFCGFRGCRAGF